MARSPPARPLSPNGNLEKTPLLTSGNSNTSNRLSKGHNSDRFGEGLIRCSEPIDSGLENPLFTLGPVP